MNDQKLLFDKNINLRQSLRDSFEINQEKYIYKYSGSNENTSNNTINNSTILTESKSQNLSKDMNERPFTSEEKENDNYYRNDINQFSMTIINKPSVFYSQGTRGKIAAEKVINKVNENNEEKKRDIKFNIEEIKTSKKRKKKDNNNNTLLTKKKNKRTKN